MSPPVKLTPTEQSARNAAELLRDPLAREPWLASLGAERPAYIAQAAARTAEVCQAYNIPAEGLPPWLADPVRRELRRRAGELLTLAGSSPADVVSAAETVDEALCKRAPVEHSTNGILAALQGAGMSCRWVKEPEPEICERCGDPGCGERFVCWEFGR